jgi:hypothetical protein
MHFNMLQMLVCYCMPAGWGAWYGIFEVEVDVFEYHDRRLLEGRDVDSNASHWSFTSSEMELYSLYTPLVVWSQERQFYCVADATAATSTAEEQCDAEYCEEYYSDDEYYSSDEQGAGVDEHYDSEYDESEQSDSLDEENSTVSEVPHS